MADKLVYVLNGPNLNLLGLREPEIYGTQTLDDIAAMLEDAGQSLGIAIDMRQSNHEGHLVDWLHEAQAEAPMPSCLTPVPTRTPASRCSMQSVQSQRR